MQRLSLIVITRNRRRLLEASLPHHLDSLPAGSRASDLLIVDNDSTDGTVDWVRRTHPETTLLSLAANTGPHGRNVGAAAAVGSRYVAFSDDDSWWERGALDHACDFLDDRPAVGLVTGSAYVGIDRRPDPINADLAETLGGNGAIDPPPLLGFLAFAAVMRREALLGSARFPMGLGMGSEEAFLALDLAAAGWSLAYLPQIESLHSPQETGDRRGRHINHVRNAMAIAMARRRGIGRWIGASQALGALPDRSTRTRALGQLAGALPWMLRNRRPIPTDIEMRRRRIDA